AKFLGIRSEEVDAKYYRQDQSRKKIGSRYHFSTVVTLKGREENIFFDILRRLFLPLSLLVLGVLIYWLYSKYLGPVDEIGFYQLQFPPEGPSVHTEPFDMFS
ncbi:MAG: hypothetical protein R3297_11340, partial [Desulfobulbales bacterium]|nr:hypothetical protein [Desulfobulbales bacterium]